jgi:glutamyl-tRNA reductase
VSSIPSADVGLSSDPSMGREPGASARPRSTPLSLFGLEFSLATASLDALETVAREVTRDRLRAWFRQLPGTEEVALLSTCHRVELVVLARYPDERDRWRDVLPGKRASWTLREGRDVVHHLFRVAAGRESLALGESEVRQQVRSARSSIESRHPRPVLRELLGGAASAADQAGSSERAPTSIAAIAARHLLEILARPTPRVVVVGSGTVGRQVTESLSPSAEVTVVYHERSPAPEFLRALGAQAVPLARLREALATADAVVTAAKFGNHGLHASDLPRDRALVLVDLGLPRNIDPEVRDLANVRLVDLEELHGLADVSGAAEAPDLRVAELAARFSDRLEGLLFEPWIDELRRAAEEVRRTELAQASVFLGSLEPEEQVAVERLTRRLVTRLLASPTERIRSLPPGPAGDLQRRLALELLRPPTDDP